MIILIILIKTSCYFFLNHSFVCILIKNVIIGWINYLQNKILRDYKISTSKLLYEYYINTNYKYFLSANPSTIIRNITTDVGHTFNYFLAKLRCIEKHNYFFYYFNFDIY